MLCEQGMEHTMEDQQLPAPYGMSACHMKDFLLSLALGARQVGLPWRQWKTICLSLLLPWHSRTHASAQRKLRCAAST